VRRLKNDLKEFSQSYIRRRTSTRSFTRRLVLGVSGGTLSYGNFWIKRTFNSNVIKWSIDMCRTFPVVNESDDPFFWSYLRTYGSPLHRHAECLRRVHTLAYAVDGVRSAGD
jgi:hypothetical protein